MVHFGRSPIPADEDPPPLTAVLARYSCESTIRSRSIASPGTLIIDLSGSRRLARNGNTVRAPIVAVRVLAALLAARGRRLSVEELVEINWGDDPTGGPNCAIGYIRSAIADARTAGAILGVSITTEHGRGYSARLMR
jgi:DNA-binding response OmpR family regulator